MPPEDGSGWVDDAPNQRDGYYIWITQVFINGNGQYGEYTNPICLPGTAGENSISYNIKTSTSTINYQDGTMYPKLISVYVAKAMVRKLQILHHQIILVGRSHIVLMAEIYGPQYHLIRFEQRAIMECCLKLQMEQ